MLNSYYIKFGVNFYTTVDNDAGWLNVFLRICYSVFFYRLAWNACKQLFYNNFDHYLNCIEVSEELAIYLISMRKPFISYKNWLAY